MPPNEFCTELSDSLTTFYKKILKLPGAGGRPVAKAFYRKFIKKAALEDEPGPVDGGPTPASAPLGSRDGTPLPPPPPPPAAAAAPTPPPKAALAKGGKGISTGRGGKGS